MCRWSASVLMLALCAVCAITKAADPPATQPSSISADDFLRQLAAPDLHARQAAVDRLAQLGPEAEPVLRDLLGRHLDADTHKNLEVALGRLRDSRVLGASLITLHLKDAPASNVLASIGEQCQATIPVIPKNLLDDAPKLSLDFDRGPFWEVMREMSERLGMEYLSSDGEVRLARSGERRHGLTSPAGAFLVSAAAIGYRSRLNVELAVYAEPKVIVARVGDFKLDRAEDDQGKPLLPLTTRRPGGRPWFGRGGFGRFADSGPRRIVLPYKSPTDDVTKISRFQGSIAVLAQAGTQTWEIADPLTLTPQTRMVGTLPVTLRRFIAKRSGKGYELQVLITEDSPDPAARDQVLESMRSRLRVLDSEGRAFKTGDLDTTRTSEGTEVTADFSFPDAQKERIGPPSRITWDIPAELRKVVIPFDFKDIPIDDPFD